MSSNPDVRVYFKRECAFAGAFIDICNFLIHSFRKKAIVKIRLNKTPALSR